MSNGREAIVAGTGGNVGNASPAGPQQATVESTPVVVTTRNVTAAELAAVTAVVQGLLAEEGDARREEPAPVPSAWQRSQRAMRGTPAPGSGRWND